MATDLKRLTFAVATDLESDLDAMKKEYFYNCSQSEMIRTLIAMGLQATKQGTPQPGRQASA